MRGSTVSVDFDAVRPQVERLCREYGISELLVFGSVARHDDRPDSDIDMLYVRKPNADLGWRFFRLEEELSQLFGRDVDLVPKEGLHWVIRDRVLSEAKAIYAA